MCRYIFIIIVIFGGGTFLCILFRLGLKLFRKDMLSCLFLVTWRELLVKRWSVVGCEWIMITSCC